MGGNTRKTGGFKEKVNPQKGIGKAPETLGVDKYEINDIAAAVHRPFSRWDTIKKVLLRILIHNQEANSREIDRVRRELGWGLNSRPADIGISSTIFYLNLFSTIARLIGYRGKTTEARIESVTNDVILPTIGLGYAFAALISSFAFPGLTTLAVFTSPIGVTLLAAGSAFGKAIEIAGTNSDLNYFQSLESHIKSKYGELDHNYPKNLLTYCENEIKKIKHNRRKLAADGLEDLIISIPTTFLVFGAAGFTTGVSTFLAPILAGPAGIAIYGLISFDYLMKMAPGLNELLLSGVIFGYRMLWTQRNETTLGWKLLALAAFIPSLLLLPVSMPLHFISLIYNKPLNFMRNALSINNNFIRYMSIITGAALFIPLSTIKLTVGVARTAIDTIAASVIAVGRFLFTKRPGSLHSLITDGNFEKNEIWHDFKTDAFAKPRAFLKLFSKKGAAYHNPLFAKDDIDALYSYFSSDSYRKSSSKHDELSQIIKNKNPSKLRDLMYLHNIEFLKQYKADRKKLFHSYIGRSRAADLFWHLKEQALLHATPEDIITIIKDKLTRIGKETYADKEKIKGLEKARGMMLFINILNNALQPEEKLKIEEYLKEITSLMDKIEIKYSRLKTSETVTILNYARALLIIKLHEAELKEAKNEEFTLQYPSIDPYYQRVGHDSQPQHNKKPEPRPQNQQVGHEVEKRSRSMSLPSFENLLSRQSRGDESKKSGIPPASPTRKRSNSVPSYSHTPDKHNK